MQSLKRILLWLYSHFLTLYPPGFRETFADELWIVFQMRLEDAAQGGVLAILRRGLRELCDILPAAFYEHRRENSWRTLWSGSNNSGVAADKHKVRNMKLKPFFRLNVQNGSRLESVLAVLPFLGTAFIILLSALSALAQPLPVWIMVPIALVIPGAFVVLFFLGLVSGFPRWSLPLTGAAISIAILPAAVLILQATGGSLNNILLGIGGLLILLLVLFFGLRRLDWKRLLEDWTLVSFMGYGITLTLLSFSFDGYRGEQPVQLAASLLLALGAWAYLRANSRSGRMIALVAGFVLAMLVVATGQAWLKITGSVSEWQTDSWQIAALQTTIFWCVAGSIAILGPALLALLPIRHSPEPTR